MSPMMIILLILILLIGSSHTNDPKYKMRENKNSLENNRNLTHQLGRGNMSKYNENIATLKSEKLRHTLLRHMSTMIKKIIQQRRSKGTKKLKIRKNENSINQDKMAIRNKLSMSEFPVENDLKASGQNRSDEDDYNAIIEPGGIPEAISKDLLEMSETSMPIVSRNARSKTRKVGSNSKRHERRITHGSEINSRAKRASEADAWIKRDFEDHQTNLKMHALVVRDEDVPPCCSPAKEVTNQRYFMCSGAVLTLKHAITTASCMHFADIYEHDVDADLAVLIGPTTPRAYVIKINRYEMHPEYNYDVDSKDHATNNVALIYLTCSIVAQDAIIPKLPKGINDDVAHMCCREGCDLITIVQTPDNRHTARIIKAKNLPAPRHDDEVPYYREFSNTARDVPRLFNKRIMPNESFTMSRRIRSPLRLAAAPIFFGKEPRGRSSNRNTEKNVESHTTKKRRKAKTSETSRGKNQQRADKKSEPVNLDDFMRAKKSRDVHIPILRALEEEGVNVEEQLAAVDWEKIEETMSKKFSNENRETMEVFVKSVVDETMKRLENVLSDDETVNGTASGLKGDPSGDIYVGAVNGSTIFGKLMANEKKNKTIASFVKVFTKVVTSLVPPNSGAAIVVSSDTSLEEKDLDDPSPVYVECPPLGAPVIADGTLVGLLAYTCDDVQTWVEWRYVNMARNMNWINRQITAPYDPAGICTEPGLIPSQPRSFASQVQENLSKPENSWRENQTDFNESRKVEWTRRHIAEEKSDNSPRNFDDARIPITETSARILKDSWYARNSQLAPRELSSERMFENFRDQSKITVVRKPQVYNVNTCYVKADGTTDCQMRTEFDVR